MIGKLISEVHLLFHLALIMQIPSYMCGGDEGNVSEKSTAAQKETESMSPKMMYQRLLRHKRATHMEAVNAVMELGHYEKQYKMVSLLTDKIVKVMGESKIVLMESGFTPGDPFPTDDKIRDAYSQIAENLAFFGDLLLRLPDITHDILKRNKESTITVHWAVSFCNETRVFEGSDSKLLHLMAQELGITEKDPDFINPYKEENIFNQMAEDIADEFVSEALKKAKKKKEKQEKRQKRRGPRLTGEL